MKMKILLAIDDSKFSQAAIRSLLAQVRSKGTEVRVLHVLDLIPAYVSPEMGPNSIPYIAEMEAERRKQAKELVQRAARMLREAGFRTSETVDDGDPKTKIIDHAKDWHADLIVLGSHGRKGLDRFLMGSVSEAVTRHAGCSVEIVRIRKAMKRGRAKRSEG